MMSSKANDDDANEEAASSSSHHQQQSSQDDDAKEETASSSSHQQQQSIQGISEGNFRQLLVDIAEWYDRLGYINMLKVLYRDHMNDNYELDMATKTMDLLRLLIGSGNLSSSKLTILHDTVKATEQFGFKPTVKNQFPNVRGFEISTFTRYRLRLLKLGMKLTPQGVVKLDESYNMPLLKNYEDNWSLIMDLEDRGELGEGNMDKFIEVLQRNGLTLAVRALLDDDVLKRPKSILTSDQGYEMGTPVLKMVKLVLPSTQDELIKQYLLNQQQKVCRNANRFTPATLNTRYQVDISHMFTDLVLLKENKKNLDAKPTTLEEVLDIIKSTTACKVLIDGEGGIGKTTLLRYISYNWAIKSHVKCHKSNETFKSKIVFPVNIRDIDTGENILDVIVKHMKLKDFNLKTNLPEDPKLIKRFIMNHDDEIVLLLDGLDELRGGNESPISLFKKDELENSTVILTSRPENIDEFIKESSVYVKVKGFNAVNIKKYINTHFNYFEVPALGHSLIKELKLDEYDYHPVYSMCTNPMLLLSICTMWEEKQYIPADKTVLFKEVFRNILNQFNRQEANEQKISTFEDTPEKFVNAMLVLGKCMYEGLKSNQLYINKKHLEGNEEMVALALKLGFVYKKANSKADFKEMFAAPHKLIVEALVGFYLCKLCQKAWFENECVEDMGKLLNSLDDDDWEIIRESKHLDMANVFAVGFLGADAGKFLNHWITNNFSTYRSLKSYLYHVEEEHMVAVEKTLIDHMNKKALELPPHIGEICTSLKKCIHHFDPCAELNEKHFIQLMQIFAGIDNLEIRRLMQYLCASIGDKRRKKCTSEEKLGMIRMIALVVMLTKCERFVLQEIYGAFTGDDFQQLTAEYQKCNFMYDIKSYTLNTRRTKGNSPFFRHLLNIAPELSDLDVHCTARNVKINMFMKRDSYNEVTLQLKTFDTERNNPCNTDGSPPMCDCSLSGVIMNDMFRECSRELELDEVIINDNNLSHISGSSLAHLMSIAPKLIEINMSNCCLSGIIMDDMSRECSNRGVNLAKLSHLNISGNNLSNIDGCSLADLIILAPKLINLNIKNCSLSGGIMNDMIERCSGREVSLKLLILDISCNNFSNINASSLASLMRIAPKLRGFMMMNCMLSGIIMNDTIRNCSTTGVELFELDELSINNNNLSHISGSSLATLITSIACDIGTLNMRNCRLSGVIVNDMIRECFSQRVELRLDIFDISYNNLSNIESSSLSSLMSIAPYMYCLYIRNCNLADDILNETKILCSRSRVELDPPRTRRGARMSTGWNRERKTHNINH